MKDIQGYEGLYAITEDGQVWSYRSNSFLRGEYLKSGYIRYSLQANGKRAKKLGHRLVAEAFLENPNNLPQVDHINRDKTNNSVENLRWVSSSDNMKNRPKRQVNKIYCFENGKIYLSQSNAARELGIPVETVSQSVRYGCKASKGFHFYRIQESD